MIFLISRDLPAALGTLKTLITLAGRFIDTGNGQSSDPDGQFLFLFIHSVVVV